MEQFQHFIDTFVGWVAEEFLVLVVGSVIGAIGTKWFFGKKNMEELGRLRREVDELKRERDGRAPFPPPISASAPADVGSKNRSLLPASYPHNALLSPKELVALVKGHTSIAAERMLEPHKGRRHHVRGAVHEVSNIGHDVVQVALDGRDGTYIMLWFAQGRQTEAMETLRVGDDVSATGLLRYVSNHISLEKCTLDGIDIDGTRSDV